MKRNHGGLSKNLLQMKFMQKSKENYENAEIAEQQRKQHGQTSRQQELLELCQKEGDKFLATNSFIFCQNLEYGRMSFKGMNPEIEQLMRLKMKHNHNDDDESETNKTAKDEADVSDDEMTNVLKRRKKKKFSS